MYLFDLSINWLAFKNPVVTYWQLTCSLNKNKVKLITFSTIFYSNKVIVIMRLRWILNILYLFNLSVSRWQAMNFVLHFNWNLDLFDIFYLFYGLLDSVCNFLLNSRCEQFIIVIFFFKLIYFFYEVVKCTFNILYNTRI